jgi:hypothetical protein
VDTDMVMAVSFPGAVVVVAANIDQVMVTWIRCLRSLHCSANDDDVDDGDGGVGKSLPLKTLDYRVIQNLDHHCHCRHLLILMDVATMVNTCYS